MAGNGLAGIFLRTFVECSGPCSGAAKQVIAYPAANEGLLDAGQGHLRHDRCRAADGGPYSGWGIPWGRCRRAFAFPAGGLIHPFMRYIMADGPPKSAQITLEVWRLRDGFHLFQNALLAAAYDEFALVCGDGAEGILRKHPRCRLTENFIMSYAGIRFPCIWDGAGACMASRRTVQSSSFRQRG